MSRGPERELEERLDAAFAGTRPRRGLQDEVLARLRRRRPWWERALDDLRARPAALAPLVAVLVVATGVYGLAHLPHGGAASGAASLNAAPAARAPGFGPLPWPGGRGTEDAPAAPVAPAVGAPAVAGSAGFSVGRLPDVPALPADFAVDRWFAPPVAEADAYAATVEPGLQDLKVAATPGAVAAYRSADVELTVNAAVAPGRPPAVVVRFPPADVPPGAAPARAAAAAALVRAGLLYDPTLVRVVEPAAGAGPVVVVHVLRHPAAGGPVDIVGPDGTPSGAAVSVGPGGTRVDAPFPHLATTSATYPAAGAGQVRSRAQAHPSAGPRVDFDQARLVYTWVVEGSGEGFLEPAVMFTSSTSPAVLLVPAVAPQYLRG